MSIKFILLLSLIAYSMVVSQSFMYLFTLKNAQMQLNASTYVEVRKLIEAGMLAKFKYVVYAALFFNLLLIVSTVNKPSSVLFITSALAFVALVIDVLVMLKGNMPINEIFRAWSVDNIPSDWMQYREDWFRYFKYRQLANITGFVALLVGAVFK